MTMAKTSKRVYVVNDGDNASRRLVEAASQAQAIAHVVRGKYVATVATQAELVDLVGCGVKVEQAGGDDE